MTVNINPLLKDPGVRPTEEIIERIVGEKIKLWQSVLKYAADTGSEVSGSWNYYNDGKQWLFKLVRRKNTILWAGIVDETFIITFYFGDKAVPAIESGNLPSVLVEGFRNAKRYGQIRPLSITLTGRQDVENICKLIDIKRKLK